MIQDIIEKIHRGDLLTEDETLQAVKNYQTLYELLSLHGECYTLVCEDVGEIYKRFDIQRAYMGLPIP